MKKIFGSLKALARTITGRNKTGQAIHGVLDLTPIPNQILVKIGGFLNDGRKPSKEELQEIFSVRNVFALVASVSFLAGWITVDDLRAFLEAINSFM